MNPICDSDLFKIVWLAGIPVVWTALICFGDVKRTAGDSYLDAGSAFMIAGLWPFILFLYIVFSPVIIGAAILERRRKDDSKESAP